MIESKERKNQATAQFQDGQARKIITGVIIDEDSDHITISCMKARYWLNKSMIDWIKYDSK